MAKKGSRSSKGSAKGHGALVSPLYESGRMNGPVAGPKGGVSPKDPFGYLKLSGLPAPGGNPAARGPEAAR